MFDAAIPPCLQRAGDAQALVRDARKAAIDDPDDHVEPALAQRSEKRARKPRRKPGSGLDAGSRARSLHILAVAQPAIRSISGLKASLRVRLWYCAIRSRIRSRSRRHRSNRSLSSRCSPAKL